MLSSIMEINDILCIKILGLILLGNQVLQKTFVFMYSVIYTKYDMTRTSIFCYNLEG